MYLEKEGVVTNSCKPYESITGEVPKCSNTCQEWEIPYTKYFCKKNSSVMAIGPISMAYLIMEKGPIVG